jgi:hypothetical protein
MSDIVLAQSAEYNVKLAVYAGESSQSLAPRLVEAEAQVSDLQDTIRHLLLKEQTDIAEAVEDRKLMADKLGALLKKNVSRSAWDRVVEELSGLRREFAAYKATNPLQQENVELRREIECLRMELEEARAASGWDGPWLAAESKRKGYEHLSKIEREDAALVAARSRSHVKQEPEPDE